MCKSELGLDKTNSCKKQQYVFIGTAQRKCPRTCWNPRTGNCVKEKNWSRDGMRTRSGVVWQNVELSTMHIPLEIYCHGRFCAKRRLKFKMHSLQRG